MRRRRFRKQPVSVALFPFLAVLICTMGSLILLLVIMVQHARVEAHTIKTRREEERKTESEQERLLREQREDAEWRKGILAQAHEENSQKLADGRLQLAHLEEHIRRLQDEWKQLTTQVEELQKLAGDKQTDTSAAAAQLSRLEQDIEQAKRELEDAKRRAAERPRSYAIVPVTPVNGTLRRPIYLECTRTAVILQPEGITLGYKDFLPPLGPGNALDAALRAAREYLAVHGGISEHGEPYPLLLIRPNGAVAYAAARDALRAWDDEFGYELLDADMELAYPPPDPALAEEVRRAVESARRRQEFLARSAPMRFRSYRNSMSDGDGAGDFSTGGERGSGALSGGGRGDHGVAGGGGTGDGYSQGRYSQGGGGGSGADRLGADSRGAGIGGAELGGAGLGGAGLGGTGLGGAGAADRLNGGAGIGINGPQNGSQSMGIPGYGTQNGGGQGFGGRPGGGGQDSTAGQQGAQGPTPGQPGRFPSGEANGYEEIPIGRPYGSGGNRGDGSGNTQPGGSGGPPGSQAAGNGSSSYGQGSAGSRGRRQTNGAARGNSSRGGAQGFGMGNNSNADSGSGGPFEGQRGMRERGRNWALKGGNGRANAYTRPVRVILTSNHIYILPEARSGQQMQSFPLDGPMSRQLDNVVESVQKQIELWGSPPVRGYWQPMLQVQVTPDGEGRFKELRALLEDSGLEVERKSQ